MQLPLSIQGDIDVPRFLARVIELFFIAKQHAALPIDQKKEYISNPGTEARIEAAIDSLSGYVSAKFSQVMPIHESKLHLLLQIVKFFFIKDFYPVEQAAGIYKAKIAPRLVVVDYFIDSLLSSRESHFEYYPLDQKIVLDARAFLFIKMETIGDLMLLFERLGQGKIKRVAKPEKMGWIIKKYPRSSDEELLLARMSDYFRASLDKPVFALLESRWGQSKYRSIEADKPIDAKNMRSLYFFCQDWVQILEDPTILDENRLQFLRLLQETYYHRALIRMQDLEMLRK